MRSLLISLLVILFTPSLQAQTHTFEQRRDTVLAFWTNGDFGNYYASATVLALDTANREKGFRMIEELTSGTSPDIIERFRMTATYVRLHAILPDDLKERFYYIWSNFPVRSFYGEHERVAYYTALYLGTQFFPEDMPYFNGRSREQNDWEEGICRC